MPREKTTANQQEITNLEFSPPPSTYYPRLSRVFSTEREHVTAANLDGRREPKRNPSGARRHATPRPLISAQCDGRESTRKAAGAIPRARRRADRCAWRGAREGSKPAGPRPSAET